MIAIINAELVMKDHLIPEAVLFIEDGKIAGFGEMRTTPVPEGCEVIDAKGAYVGPVWWTSTPTPVIATVCGRSRSPAVSTTWSMAPPRCCLPPTPG